MLDTAARTLGPLAAETMRTTRAFFTEREHYPSDAHWAALTDIAVTLEAMADGVCPPLVHLSAIDPGVGKSASTAHFARALVTSDAHRDAGMIVCVGRIAEAVALASSLDIPRDRLAVLTTDPAANALGGAEPTEAQILITTQQRIERQCDGRPFEDVQALHFRGRPRRVRAWEEAWLPGAVMVLDRDGIFGLLRYIRKVSPRLRDVLEDFAVSLRHVADDSLVDVPDIGAVAGISPWEVMTMAAGISGRFRDDHQMAATALVTMSGKAARVRRDGKAGATVLTYRDTLPEDLAPLLVLDASGRVRETYRHVEAHRGTLKRLGEAVKDYSPLTINVWKTAGGKSGWESNGDELVKGIVGAIESKPTEPWLVVLHKPDAKVGDVAKAIRRALPADTAANVRTLTYGQHMATNEYASVPNVILAGTLFMAPSFYTALTHLAQDRDTAAGLVSNEEVAKTMKGENAHHILQALCRGRVRKSDGDRCQPMEAWIIASARSGIPNDLAEIFPGCSVRPWKPTEARKKITGKPLKALEVAREAVAAGSLWVPYGDLARSVQMDPRNFKKRIAANDGWRAAVSTLGLSPAQGARGAWGLMRIGTVERAA